MKMSRQQTRGNREKLKIERLPALLCAFCWLLAALIVPGAAESSEGKSLMDDIKHAVMGELKNSISENVEVNGIRVIKGREILREEADYRVAKLISNGHKGRNKIVFTILLLDKKNEPKDILVDVSFDIMMEVLVASKPLAAGDALTDDDFYTIRQKSTRLPADAVLKKEELEGKILKTNIGQGLVIRANYFSSQAAAKRGQKVNVIVEGGNVVVSAQGRLRNNADIGDSARVLCDTSKKEVTGILVSHDTVRVKI